MTILDTSAVVDFLLGEESHTGVARIFRNEGTAAAPDLLTFEVIAVLRRLVQRGELDQRRAGAAIDDLGDLPLEIFPSMALRERAWALRENLTAADALFVALAERLDEPLATKDHRLAAAAETHANVAVIDLA